MDFVEVIGLSAALLTTIAFIPQLIKIIKSKQVGDISLKMYIIFITGVSLWLVYGIYRNDLPIITANIITLILALCILFLKFKYDKNQDRSE